MENESKMNKSFLRQQIISDIIEISAVKGLMMKSSANPSECDYSHVPNSVFPTPYPQEHYLKAKAYQNPLACLISSLVSKPSVIHEVLRFFQE